MVLCGPAASLVNKSSKFFPILSKGSCYIFTFIATRNVPLSFVQFNMYFSIKKRLSALICVFHEYRNYSTLYNALIVVIYTIHM